MAHQKNDPNNLPKRADEEKQELPLDLNRASPDAIQTLLHELQVHQIELELQNEELRRVQDELQAAHRKYTYLFDFAPVGYFTLSQLGVIEEVNQAGAALVGMEKDQLVRRSFSELVCFEDQDAYYLNLRRFFGAPSSHSMDLRMVRGDGAVMYAHLVCLVLPGNEIQSLHSLMVVTDITEQKRDEQEALLLAATQERERLARDLHDTVSQALYASLLVAETLPRLWERSPERAFKELIHLQKLNRGALAEIRTLLLDLRPAALLDVDMLTLLSQLTVSIQSRKKLAIALQVHPDVDVPPLVKIALYRITQEALNNVVKYAHAHHVTINLSHDETQVELSIQDDGHGFEPDNLLSTGFGLKIMRERAEAIGATLHIASQLKQGTTLSVTWPIPSGQ
jgi:PAS domain S-box-containing protein